MTSGIHFPWFANRKSKKFEDSANIMTFHENLELPDIKHDFELIINMLNHMRQQKNLKRTDCHYLFIQMKLTLHTRRENFPFMSQKLFLSLSLYFRKDKLCGLDLFSVRIMYC